MIPDMFGKPEAYGVVMAEEAPGETRRVHVTGHIKIEVDIDEWIDAEPDETNAEIKQAAIEAAGVIFDSRADVHDYLDIEDETKRQARAKREQERQLLMSWNRGEPIVAPATPPRAR